MLPATAGDLRRRHRSSDTVPGRAGRGTAPVSGFDKPLRPKSFPNTALAPLGVKWIDMPLTPMRVWDAIEEAKGDAA